MSNLVTLFLTIALLTTPSVGSETPTTEEISVLLIMADDLGANDFDMIPTPNLDALASQGMTFRRGYSHPVCSATRISLLFGEWYGEHHKPACIGYSQFDPESPQPFLLKKASLAKLLTGLPVGLFGKWHIGTNKLADWQITPFLHGFTAFRAGSASIVTACGGSSYESWLRVDNAEVSISTEYNTSAIAEEYMSWPVSTPRVAWVSFNTPHVPLHTPPTNALPPNTIIPPIDEITARQQYELMVQSMDYAIGQILEEVDLEKTIVIFTADNGTPPEAASATQDPNKMKKTTFEDGIRVPLIVAGPGIVQGQSQQLVHLIDLYATIPSLLGKSSPPSDARDFSSLLHGDNTAIREFIYSEHHRPNDNLRDRAIVTKRFKFRNFNGQEELYDLLKDPEEENPLSLNRSGVNQLRAWLEDPSNGN